jgi:AraC-like DNA-binding protein
VPQPTGVNRLILHFEIAYFENLSQSLKSKRFSKALLAENDTTGDISVHTLLEEQITAIIREQDARCDAYRLALKARLLDILVILLRHIPLEDYAPQERNRHLNHLGRLENVFSYIEKNYSSDISLDEISAVANFSEYYFTRFFKEATGMTFGKYLNNFRVEKAALFLKNEDSSITEVVFKSGFGSIKTFNRVFRQIKGCSPSSYKKALFKA